MNNKIVIIVNDIRSAHNVGSLIRTADGFGVSHIYFTGYTPYPVTKNDKRLPHISSKITTQISKTALGAENEVFWSHHQNLIDLISKLKSENYEIIALEQNNKSISIREFVTQKNTAVLIGNEVNGIDPALIELCDKIVEIPMFGKKESLNVVQATAVLLYQIKVISAGKH